MLVSNINNNLFEWNKQNDEFSIYRDEGRQNTLIKILRKG